jgi:hypothetical protein
MNDKKDLRRLFEDQFPRASLKELEKMRKTTEANRRRVEQLRNDLQELQDELAARNEIQGPPPWPGALEPLVLAAAFLTRGGDLNSIVEKVMELSSRPYELPSIRSTTYRLVRRELLSESDRSFTITPQGERELAQAQGDAKRWIEALELLHFRNAAAQGDGA